MGVFRIFAGLCAAALAWSGSVFAQQTARSLETVMADLAKGGSVILMRHANSPSGQIGSVGLTDKCVLAEGRGLDAKGFFQARFIGEFLASKNVPIAAGFTSDMCRCWDTARLVAAGAPVDPAAALKSTNVSEIDIFKTAIAGHIAAHPASNILLVTHSNIVPLFADWGTETEIPSGVVLIVDPKTWTIKDKLNMDVDLAVEGQ